MTFQERQVLHRIPVYVAAKSVEEGALSVRGAGGATRLPRGKGGRPPIKLASNENAFGTSPKVLRALKGAAREVSVYPGMHYEALRQAIAKFYRLRQEQVVLGNGSDELMGIVVQTLVNPKDEVILSQGTFSVYEKVVRLAGGTPVSVPLRDGTYDLDAMRRRVTRRTRLVFLCNPNNPTGTIFTERELAVLMKELPDRVVVVMDEAYYEYVTSRAFPKSLSWIQRRNVVVLRTFSKAYGLAGLRIGYALGPAKLMRWFNEVVRLPFNVNRMAEVGARAALQDQAFLRKCQRNNVVEKQRLLQAFARLGLRTLPSEANFIYFEVPAPSDHRTAQRVSRGMAWADQIAAQLLQEGVIVRPLTAFGMPHALRVTIGKPSENRRFVGALRRVMGKLGT